MKPSSILPVALLLAACASPGTPSTATASSASAGGSGIYYCWKDRLASEGDNLVCNWETSANAACRSDAVVTLSRAKLASAPVDSRRCENGQWLVSASAK